MAFVVERLKIRTRLLPTLDTSLDKSATGWFTRTTEEALKPQISMRVMGQNMTVYEPYGPPGETLFWPVLAVACTALVGLGYYLGSR